MHRIYTRVGVPYETDNNWTYKWLKPLGFIWWIVISRGISSFQNMAYFSQLRDESFKLTEHKSKYEFPLCHDVSCTCYVLLEIDTQKQATF